MKLNALLLLALVGAVVYLFTLRRQLQAAQMRGDMYRDISARLDRRVAELTGQ
jgi:preprotein translocase subunit YajC